MSNSPSTIFDFDYLSLPLSGLLTAVVLAFLLGILIALIARFVDSWVIHNHSREMRQARFRKAKLIRAQQREENFRQQLRKPTFESRLRTFAGHSPSDQQPVSKMEFWQADDLELKYAPAKPLELIRAALIRLSKLFCGK